MIEAVKSTTSFAHEIWAVMHAEFVNIRRQVRQEGGAGKTQKLYAEGMFSLLKDRVASPSPALEFVFACLKSVCFHTLPLLCVYAPLCVCVRLCVSTF